MIFHLITIFACTAQFSATVYSAPAEVSATSKSAPESESIAHHEITPEAVGKVVQKFAQLNSVLATVYRFPKTVADEMDSNLSKLEETYPADTNVGGFVATLRTILKNRPALKGFSYLEQADIKWFEQLVHAKPELFAPLFNSFERIMEDFTKGSEDVTSKRSFANTPYTEGESPAVTKLRQYVELNSALASIFRITPKAAAEIDSAFSKLIETTYPESTPFGQALMRQRTLLKNRRMLSVFNFLEKAGAGKLEKLLAAKPQWFGQSAQPAVQN